MDPYERADITSDQYYDWTVKNVFIAQQGVFKAAKFLETFVRVSAQPEGAELFGRPDRGGCAGEDREAESGGPAGRSIAGRQQCADRCDTDRRVFSKQLRLMRCRLD